MSTQTQSLEMLIPPVNIADHFQLSIILLVLGFILTCIFLLYKNFKFILDMWLLIPKTKGKSAKNFFFLYSHRFTLE